MHLVCTGRSQEQDWTQSTLLCPLLNIFYTLENSIDQMRAARMHTEAIDLQSDG